MRAWSARRYLACNCPNGIGSQPQRDQHQPPQGYRTPVGAGHRDGELFLAKQPRDQKQALSWLRWFSLHRYTVSIGLMQVNADMAPQLQVRPEQLLEPCTNVRIGATILTAVYTQLAREMGEGFSALDVALSFYNSGDSSAGSRNGYVASVYAHAPRRLP